MVCPNCGTLNSSDREQCFQCLRPFSAASLRNAAVCANHPDRPAQSHCSVCGCALCARCATPVDEVIYCDGCLDLLALPGADGSVVLTPDQIRDLGPAPPGARAVAGAVDFTLVGCGAMILALLFWLFSGDPPGTPWQPGVNLLYWLVVLLGAGAYFTVTVASDGRTLGYAQTGLVVLMADGSMLTLRTAAVRYAASLFSAFCLMVGFLWVFIDPEKRTWHDRIADTVVVQLDDQGA